MPTTPASPKPLRNGLVTLIVGLSLAVVMPQVRLADPTLRRVAPGEVEAIKEQELLEALDRRGRLTAVQASLETSLGAEEASRMLFELAAQGHLEISVEYGRLLYGFWGEHGS